MITVADLALDVVAPEVRAQLEAIVRSQSMGQSLRNLRRALAAEQARVDGEAAASFALAAKSLDAVLEHIRRAVGPCPVRYERDKEMCEICAWREDCAREQAGRSVV